jgi:MFS family permease
VVWILVLIPCLLSQIQSKTTGIIMSATEIGQIGSSLLLTYYGGQGHRPKWIAWGMVLFAVSSFTCSLPHFIFGDQLLHANGLLVTGMPPPPGARHMHTLANMSSVGDSPLFAQIPPNLCTAQVSQQNHHLDLDINEKHNVM